MTYYIHNSTETLIIRSTYKSTTLKLDVVKLSSQLHT